jgi:hypothetical protein
MPPKPDLRQAISSANTRSPQPAREAPPAKPNGQVNSNYRPSRVGKANVTGYFPAPVKKQLRIIAAERETTIEDCLAEAINDFFAKNNRPELAPRKIRQ